MAAPDVPAPRRSAWRAIAALLVVTVIWGCTFVWMKQGMAAAEAKLGPGNAVPAVALFIVVRFGLAAACMAACVPSARRLSRPAWTGGLAIGALLFGGFALQMLGLEDVSPAVSAFLTSLYVLFTALLTAGIERRGPSWGLGAGVLLATIGAGVIRGRPEVSFNLGEILTVACAALFALHILATDRFTKRVAPMPITLTSFAWTALGGALMLLATRLASRAPPIDALVALLATREFLVPVLLSSLFATVIALSLMNLYQRELDPVRAAILYAFEPIWAALFGIACGMDRFSAWLLVGGSLLLAGNLAAELGQRGRARATAGIG